MKTKLVSDQLRGKLERQYFGQRRGIRNIKNNPGVFELNQKHASVENRFRFFYFPNFTQMTSVLIDFHY